MGEIVSLVGCGVVGDVVGVAVIVVGPEVG